MRKTNLLFELLTLWHKKNSLGNIQFNCSKRMPKNALGVFNPNKFKVYKLTKKNYKKTY